MILAETASSPNFSSRGVSLSKTDVGKYHSSTLLYAGSDVAGFGSVGRESMKPESVVDGFAVDPRFEWIESASAMMVSYLEDLIRNG